MQARTIIAATIVALLSFACANETASNFFRSTPTFYPTAQQNYEMGVKELKSGNWLSAQAYFLHVHKNFGFSQVGDAVGPRPRRRRVRPGQVHRGRSTATRASSRQHPGNERVQDGYAAYRIGLSYFKEIPSDFFIMPPSYEKDQGPVIDALRELTRVRRSVRRQPVCAEARQLIGECVRKLTDHELYVARFYLDNNKPYAAIGRLEGSSRTSRRRSASRKSCCCWERPT